jgi:hypothetical protein
VQHISCPAREALSVQDSLVQPLGAREILNLAVSMWTSAVRRAARAGRTVEGTVPAAGPDRMAKSLGRQSLVRVTRMLMLIFRSSLEADVFALLRELRVKAFSDVPEVLGVGQAGIAFHSFPSPGFNCMILAALDEREAKRVIAGVRRFYGRIGKAQNESAVPLRLFVLPCTQAI